MKDPPRLRLCGTYRTGHQHHHTQNIVLDYLDTYAKAN